ncbi:MAG: hypothetical protein KBE04_02020 [Phycisphaerae bacterium]|nr:hypothetical protein [Phycisphaerae bacterium]
MRTSCSAVLLATLLLVCGCSSGGSGGESYVRAGYDFSKVDVVALVDVSGVIESESIKNQIAEFFSKQLLKKGYGPIERPQIQRMLAESGQSLEDLKKEAYAIEAGRVLALPVVLAVHVPNFGMETSITAKIIEVDQGSTLWVGSGAVGRRRASWLSMSDDEFSSGFSSGIFNNAQGPYTTSEEQKKREQERRAQRTLTVQEAREVEKVVKEICKSLPYRMPDLQTEGSGFRMPKIGSDK